MARSVAEIATAATIYANAFVVGGVLMGFEMLGSRYLFPYFGGGIGTWASLISMVLCALAIGYFVGGAIVDRHPSPRVVAVAIMLAAAYLAFVPAAADHVMSWILAMIGDGAWATLLAAAALLLLPLSLLGTLSPVAVRLLIRSTGETGRVAGLVYGISTIGNVVGTLLTTFTLIPTIGSRSITYLYAAVLAASAASLFCAHRRAV
ncbi:MAG TPA: fused MFS/spermidine synthase [Methylomirabilota bacterium]|nr:fused MFS/spermidine synthase [Methylomirabilota bacterium]